MHHTRACRRVLAKCRRLLDFKAPLWGQGPLLQLYLAIMTRAPTLEYVTQHVKMRDGGSVQLDWAEAPGHRRDAPVLIVLHGIGACFGRASMADEHMACCMRIAHRWFDCACGGHAHKGRVFTARRTEPIISVKDRLLHSLSREASHRRSAIRVQRATARSATCGAWSPRCARWGG
jgi:hypothetical protein